MADPLSAASGVVGLVTFAFQASLTLYTAIRKLQNQDRNSRALKGELNDLTQVLETLLETVSSHPEINFDALASPLKRCGNACKEYGDLVAECTKHSTGSRASVRDWFKQLYLQGDINDFKSMLAVYKSTINIALANANLRVAAVTPKVVEDYKDMMRDTTSELQDHLRSLQEKMKALAAQNATSTGQDNGEWQAMLEEKESTQQGLEICAQLSAEIEHFETTTKEHPLFSQRQSAQKHIRAGFSSTKGSIQSLVFRLQSYGEDLDKKIEAMGSSVPISDDSARELTRLQETKESIGQCIEIVSSASENLSADNRNVFEDITMADNSYEIQVSTVGALFTARRVNLTGRARHITGQISDESVQKAMEGLVQLDTKYDALSAQPNHERSQTDSSSGPDTRDSGTNELHLRYGRGIKLSSAETAHNPSQNIRK